MPTDAAAWRWWIISVLMVGIVLSIAGNLATRLLDKWWGRYSDTRRIKNEKKHKEFEEAVITAVHYPSEFTWLNTQFLGSLVSGLTFLILFGFSSLYGTFSLTKLVFQLMTGIAIIMFLNRGASSSRILREARKRMRDEPQIRDEPEEIESELSQASTEVQ